MLTAQSCLGLCDPMDYSPPGSLVHGILQARTLEWAAMPFSKGIFATQGSNPGLLHWQANSLGSEPPGKPVEDVTCQQLEPRGDVIWPD